MYCTQQYDMNGRFQKQGGKKTGFCRNTLDQMQTGSSGTLIGWKSSQTTYVPLWDRMEGGLREDAKRAGGQ
jgi:hypothetical protein